MAQKHISGLQKESQRITDIESNFTELYGDYISKSSDSMQTIERTGSTGDTALEVKSAISSGSFIKFTTNGGVSGYFGVDSTGKATFYDTASREIPLFGVTTQTGDLYVTNLYQSSDRRLKENIVDSAVNFSGIVEALKIKEFNFKKDKEKTTHIGIIAQELRDTLPEKYVKGLVGGGETEGDFLSINEGKLVYILLGALQSEIAKRKELEEKINAMLEKK